MRPARARTDGSPPCRRRGPAAPTRRTRARTRRAGSSSRDPRRRSRPSNLVPARQRPARPTGRDLGQAAEVARSSRPASDTGTRNAADASAAPVSSAGRRRKSPTTSATTVPATESHTIHAGAGFLSTYSKSPGYTIWRNIPAPRASGRRIGPTSRASTPMPPANANANGRNPAARRACEIETRSASDVKRKGSNMNGEDGERASDDVRRPAPSGGESGERNRGAAPRSPPHPLG